MTLRNGGQDRRGSLRLGEPDGSSTVIMIGANELANMVHQAAVDYGVRLDIIVPQSTRPYSAQMIGDSCKHSAHATLDRQRVLTFATDQISSHQLRDLELSGDAMRPGLHALNFSRDLLFLREALCSVGDLSIATPSFSAAMSATDIDIFAQQYGWPVVLKARWTANEYRQVQIVTSRQAADRFLGCADRPSTTEKTDKHRGYWIVEEYLEPTTEFIVLVARRPSGYWVSYPPIEIGRQGGLHSETSMPANLSSGVAEQATQLAVSLLAGIDAVGIAAIKYFWTADARLLLDQIWLRPHGFGKLTLEGCQTSQFHQHLRAILDWPLGTSTLISPVATLELTCEPGNENFLSRVASVLKTPGVFLHLYPHQWQTSGHFGHITALGDTTDDALSIVREAAKLFRDS
ncbi:MAG: ATP-grasp domain-containing protein [Actinomycetota bacterium]|jgi:5-(carboxyamino)imidazole ribonucleotide synthase|nr:ATP-grasp domain-containing protein [Actinomycetota bacterium]